MQTKTFTTNVSNIFKNKNPFPTPLLFFFFAIPTGIIYDDTKEATNFHPNVSIFNSFIICLIAVPPDIIYDDTSGDVAISEGENATLWCHATGHPPPKITWKREDGDGILLRKALRDIIKGESAKRFQPRIQNFVYCS